MPTIQSAGTRDLKASLAKVTQAHSTVHEKLAHKSMDAAERKQQRHDALASNRALLGQQGK